MMRTFLYAAGLAGVMVTFSVMAAQAGACDAVEREMAFGEAAAEDAKDKAGFKRAAEQFSNAAHKAPRCAAAFFNLGVVKEKVGSLSEAKRAFERYVALQPKSPDAAAVRKKIYKLEYRITQNIAKALLTQSASRGSSKSVQAKHPVSPWNKLEGAWRSVNDSGSQPTVYDITVRNGRIRVVMRTRSDTFPNGCRIDMREEYTGSISTSGMIDGTRKDGDKRYENRCRAGSLPAHRWNYTTKAMTGRIIGKGSVIEFNWRQLVQGRNYPAKRRLMRY